MKILSSTVAVLCTFCLALPRGHYVEAAVATAGRASSGALGHRLGSAAGSLTVSRLLENEMLN